MFACCASITNADHKSQDIGSLAPNNFSWHNSAVKFIGIKGTQNYVKSEQLSRSDSRVDNLYLTSVYLYIHWSSLILRYTANLSGSQVDYWQSHQYYINDILWGIPDYVTVKVVCRFHAVRYLQIR